MGNKDGLEIGTEKKEGIFEGTLGLWPQFQGQTTALFFTYGILKEGSQTQKILGHKHEKALGALFSMCR